MNKLTKKLRSDVITFADPKDAKAVAYAEMGVGNYAINARTRKTKHQINYRLAKHQRIHGLTGGYRRGWARMESPMAIQVIEDMVEVRAAEIMRETPAMIEHMTPEVVKV